MSFGTTKGFSVKLSVQGISGFYKKEREGREGGREGGRERERERERERKRGLIDKVSVTKLL